jgi:WD40 repeat protein
MKTEISEADPVVEPVGAVDDAVASLSWSMNDDLLAVGCLDGTVSVFDGTLRRPSPPMHPLGVADAQWHPSLPLLAVGGLDGVVRLWDGEHGEVVGEATAKGWCAQVAWSPTGRELAAAVGKTVVRMDTAGSELRRHGDHDATVACLAWTPDGRSLGAGMNGGIWWYQDGVEVWKTFEYAGALLALAIAPSGRWIASGNHDSSVHCWRLWTEEELFMSGYEQKILQIAWSRDSRFLAVGNPGEVTVWDFSGKGPRGSKPSQFTGHERRIVALAYQPGGRRLMSAGAEGTLCLWDPMAKRRLISTMTFDTEISTARWNGRGDRIAVACTDGSVSVVRIPTAWVGDGRSRR